MRVALIAFGSVGDVQPFVTLGEALSRAGHQVLFCGYPDVGNWVDLRGLDFCAVGGLRPAQPRARRPAPWFVELYRFARAEAAPQFNALLQAARDVDLVLSTGSQLVVASVAHALGVRHRSVLLCPQMLPSRRYPPLAVPWPGAPALLQRAGRRFFIEAYNHLIRGPVARCRRQIGLPALTDEFAANFFTHPIVACDPELAPIPKDCPLPAEQVGYLHPQMPTSALPAALQDFLAAEKAPVYIGFGSTTPAPPAILTGQIVAAVHAVGCRAILSRGWARLGGGEYGETIYVTGPVSHYALFPHVAAVVHHGGAGTTATAAWAGRPQIILPPSLYDQGYWRAQVVARGLGVWAPAPQRLTVSMLAGALERVLADRDMTLRAAALGAVLRQRDAVGNALQVVRASV
jgi:vancomycin aglycone glucosyltransferase